MRVTSDVGPFSITPEWVLDAEVSDRAIRLYGLLGRYANNNGSAYPNRKTLAKRLRCSIDSVDRAARELVSIGALEKTARWTGNGDQTSNLCRLIYAAPVQHPSRNHAATPLRNGAARNESQLERETTLAAAPRERPRNEVWDALTERFGEATTRTSQTLRGKIVKSLTAAGATPAEIHIRAKRWPLIFPSAVLTETALEKHWPLLEPPRRREPSAPPKPQAEPTEAERAANVEAARAGLRELRRNL